MSREFEPRIGLTLIAAADEKPAESTNEANSGQYEVSVNLRRPHYELEGVNVQLLLTTLSPVIGGAVGA